MSERTTGALQRPTMLVTGATDGIGRELARRLVEQGASVLVHGRSRERAAPVARELAVRGPGHAEPVWGDYAVLEEVRGLAAQVAALVAPTGLQVLVNNAGLVHHGPRALTGDGFELTWQVNHLAGFLLTRLLEDELRRGSPARIVIVSSNAHASEPIHRADPNGLTGWPAYGQSKLAQLMTGFELAERLAPARVTVNATHPGWIATKLGGDGPHSVAEGAETPLWLATDPSLERRTGGYYVGRQHRATSRETRDAEARRWLWALSERSVGPSR